MDTPHPEKSSTASGELAHDFVQFSLNAGVLKFGSFQTKAGRMSPYFFNAGLFDDGAKLSALAGFYAKCIIASGIEFDVLFGPAYKGISLAAAVAIELARMGRNVPFAYNRKEAKTHGEGGVMVGAAIAGRVLIVDDVISAGTATRESMALIAACGAKVVGVAIALDRQEKARIGGVDQSFSPISQLRDEHGLQVCAIATLSDLLMYLQGSAAMTEHRNAVAAYRTQYGVTN